MIFNKSNNGQEELKAIIGFVYLSNDFNDIKTYIRIAEKDLKKIIGNEIFDVALTHYKSDDFDPDDLDAPIEEEEGEPVESFYMLNNLVVNIQTAIAFNAYMRYAPGNDLSHDATGRKMNIQEGQKSPWEWMIDRDDQNLLNLYHTAVDTLLEFLDENKDDTALDEWGTSPAYEKSKELLINNADTFNEFVFINSSRRLFVEFIPIMKRIEKDRIRPCSVDLYDDIKEQVMDDDVSAENEPILLLMREAVALLTVAKACTQLNVAVMPDGIFQYTSGNPGRQANKADRVDRLELAKQMEKEGYDKLAQLQKAITVLSGTDSTDDLDTTEFTKYMTDDKKYISL